MSGMKPVKGRRRARASSWADVRAEPWAIQGLNSRQRNRGASSRTGVSRWPRGRGGEKSRGAVGLRPRVGPSGWSMLCGVQC